MGRSGSFALSLPAGTYLVVATTVAPNGKVTVSKVGVSLRAGQRRSGSTLDRRRNGRDERRPTASVRRAEWRQQGGQVSPGRVAVEIPDLTGTTTSPGWDAVLRGANDMLTTEAMNGTRQCGGIDFLEVDRRADLLAELEFQRSKYVDPATRVKPNFIVGDVEVRGTVADGPARAGVVDVTLVIVNKGTGQEVGVLTQSVAPATLFEDLGRLGASLADELCSLTDYDVTMDVVGVAKFATHEASAALRTTITARREGDGLDTVWRGRATTVWEDLSFVSLIAPCTYVSPQTTEFDWSVEIRLADAETLSVTWGQENLGPDSYPTAALACAPAPPIPGQPGPSLVGATPQTFTIPTSGGSAPVPNGITNGGLGYFTTGSVTVRTGAVAPRR